MKRPLEPIRIRIDADLFEIIPAYLDTLNRSTADMKKALAHGDHGVIMRIGHQMKGEGAAFGLDEISVIGKRLQSAAETGDTHAMHADLDVLDDYLARLELSPR